MRDELEIKGVITASLENKVSGLISELESREQAIAKLKTELEAGGEVKQLNFFPPEPTPTPEPVTEPETIPTPNPTPEPKAKSKAKSKPGTVDLLTVGTPGLVEYINSIKPESGIIAKTIGNAINRKNNGNGDGNGKNMGRSLDSLESDYNFKHLGKVGNSHKFSIPKL